MRSLLVTIAAALATLALPPATGARAQQDEIINVSAQAFVVQEPSEHLLLNRAVGNEIYTVGTGPLTVIAPVPRPGNGTRSYQIIVTGRNTTTAGNVKCWVRSYTAHGTQLGFWINEAATKAPWTMLFTVPKEVVDKFGYMFLRCTMTPNTKVYGFAVEAVDLI